MAGSGPGQRGRAKPAAGVGPKPAAGPDPGACIPHSVRGAGARPLPWPAQGESPWPGQGRGVVPAASKAVGRTPTDLEIAVGIWYFQS